ncbi:P-loop containing nucleoside triphosphate hydrolase protein [Chytriomyces sp. MP71]|nr:P-loop containing nucleoside triphosphate hydrolase protein [Chytriomyces sp. MP71]
MSGSGSGSGSTSSLAKATVSAVLVALRIRPLSNKEVKENATANIKIASKQSLIVTDYSDAQDPLRHDRPREKLYEFDAVYPETASQGEVFEGTTKGLVDSVLQGFNTTVFAYGATGAGKTYTMLGTQENPGIMPQTLDHLFSQIKKATTATPTAQRNQLTSPAAASAPPLHQSFKVSLSYLEIYNENIRDLLSGRPDYLELWEDRLRGSVVAGIERVEAKTSADVLEWLEKGNMNRTQEATGANEASSRSHAVLQVFVARRTCNKKGQYTEQNGKLSMIDLAGSERAADTKNRGMRMIEGASINRSLLALGNCINALSDDGGTGKYVNYRDSKLTRLLKDSLGGNCKTVMIANISPATVNFEETLNTLKYAHRTRAIKNRLVQQPPLLIPKPQSLPTLAPTTSSMAAASTSSVQDSSTGAKPKMKRSNSDRTVFQRLTESSGKPAVQSRYMGGQQQQGQQSKPGTAAAVAGSMLGEFENCLLEAFSERRQVQRSLNALDLKLALVDEKRAWIRRREGAGGGRARRALRYEEEENRLRNLRKNLARKGCDLDDKVKSIHQTLPRSLDAQSLRYLDTRIKTHYVDTENLKLEGLQTQLSSKLQRQDTEMSAFVNQIILFKSIASMQRELLEQKHIPLPVKLQETYQKLQAAASKPDSSESTKSSLRSAGSSIDGDRRAASSESAGSSSDESGPVVKAAPISKATVVVPAPLLSTIAGKVGPPPTKILVAKPALVSKLSAVSITDSESTIASSASNTSLSSSNAIKRDSSIVKLPQIPNGAKKPSIAAEHSKRTSQSTTTSLPSLVQKSQIPVVVAASTSNSVLFKPNHAPTGATAATATTLSSKIKEAVAPTPSSHPSMQAPVKPKGTVAAAGTKPAHGGAAPQRDDTNASLASLSATDLTESNSTSRSGSSSSNGSSATCEDSGSSAGALSVASTPSVAVRSKAVAAVGNAGVVSKQKQGSNARTLREAREEIQVQIREARAERQRARQEAPTEAKGVNVGVNVGEKMVSRTRKDGKPVDETSRSLHTEPIGARPPSESLRKAKVVAGKGIIA